MGSEMCIRDRYETSTPSCQEQSKVEMDQKLEVKSRILHGSYVFASSVVEPSYGLKICHKLWFEEHLSTEIQ